MGFMPIGGSFRGRDDDEDEHPPCQLESCRYPLTEKQGKRIRLYLKLYSARLHEFGAREEGDEVWELAKLFE